jgi:hypothetical protein
MDISLEQLLVGWPNVHTTTIIKFRFKRTLRSLARS